MPTLQHRMQPNLGHCNLHPYATTSMSRPVEDCDGSRADPGIRNLRPDGPNVSRTQPPELSDTHGTTHVKTRPAIRAPGTDSQCKSGPRNVFRKVRLEYATFDCTRHSTCLVQWKI